MSAAAGGPMRRSLRGGDGGAASRPHSDQLGHADHGDRRESQYSHPGHSDGKDDGSGQHRRQISRSEEEGVEVVLGESGGHRVVDGQSKPPRPTPDQHVFRPPHAVRPRAVRPHGGQPSPHAPSSGSFGYGHPPSRGDYPPPRRPYSVPHAASSSFDEGSYHQQSHYSPHVQYPPAGGRYSSEDVNVISPNHKGDPHYRPPTTPRPRPMPPPHHYQYPPTSPVSRSGGHRSNSNSPPRLRNYSLRRAEGPYAAAQRGEYHPDDGTWNAFPPPSTSSDQRHQPPLVTESSFDSDHYTGSHRSHGSQTPGGRAHQDQHQFYGGGSWGSFDSASGPQPPGPHPPHFDDYRYYGYPHPESPYSPHSNYSHYSPPAPGYHEHYPPHHGYDRPDRPHSYPEGEGALLKEYYPDSGEHKANAVTPNEPKKGRSSGTPVSSNTSSSGILLPKAAQEVDFEVTDPPTEPVTPPSDSPVCDSPADVNSYDVLCGRGGGTNSQIGNRRFRKLVQEFQPTYLLARRKEKPLLARTIVLIIRKRGGRFLKKDDETGELYEVGDAKAEAKTSQALREGLDVRATKSAANNLLEKKKKKKSGNKTKDDEQLEAKQESNSDEITEEKKETNEPKPPESPPTLPRLQGEEAKTGLVHPHSPEAMQFRKRRRMRSGGCIPLQDKLFPDFCPPRADLARTSSPTPDEAMPMELSSTPLRRNTSNDDSSVRYEDEHVEAAGCAGIALDIVTGAAAGSFCVGPRRWR